MSDIRRQSIISSLVVYFGFALGFLNTYLFTREGGFTQTQYGLTSTFISIANIMLAFANMGTLSYIYKFFPYYQDNLDVRQNDLLSRALINATLGYALVIIGGILLKDLVVRKFGANSTELVLYYGWIFPFGYGLTLYTVLEAYAWQIKKSVFTSYLREVQFRLVTTLLIVLFLVGLLPSFDRFIKLYSLGYLILASTLLIYLVYTNRARLTFKKSKVTRRFRKKIFALSAFTWSGGLVVTISRFFAMIVIAAVLPNGLAFAGIYALAQNIASLIQAPQRGIIASSIAPLSRAWKDKDYAKIQRIYHRSSINQLLFASAMFVLVWINFSDGVFTFHLQKGYLDARHVFLFIGLMQVVDMGTGVNAQIIATSTFWRFEFVTGVLLLAVTLPLNYILTKKVGVAGPAIADFFTFFLYNAIRYFFLYRKFGMQPFNTKTLLALILVLSDYAFCHFFLLDLHGLVGIMVRSTIFIVIYISGVLALKITPDILPVWRTITKKLGWRKG